MINKAYMVAANAHTGQVDKAGADYINHPLAVAAMVNSETERVVALLHDVVEDSNVTLRDLKENGFSDEVIEAVDCLTKRKNEPLKNYLLRVKNNALAVTVKIADLNHNSDISRIPSPTEKDVARTARYKREIDYLLDKQATIFF